MINRSLVTRRGGVRYVSRLRGAAGVLAVFALLAVSQFLGVVEPASAQPPTTTVLVPSNDSTVSGTMVVLVASTSSGTTQVQFVLEWGTQKRTVIGTAVATIYGWIALWNSTTVPNGTYRLRSIAHATDVRGTSKAITVTVDNPPPTTSIVIPSNNATVSGIEVLDAVATSAVSQVQYEVSGGPSNLNDQVVATATPTIYGWIAQWDTTSVPDGTYTLQSVASYSGGVSGSSLGISITVAPTVSFAASVEFPFSSGQAVGVVLNQPATDTVQVDFVSADGPPVTIQCCQWIGAASSFTPSSGTVTFAPGQTSATITLTVSPTTVSGCSILAPRCFPSVTLTLVNPTNVVLGSTSSTNVFYSGP
jgi:hypothetical protein